MLSVNFWRKYFEVYDVLNLLIPYQELLKSVCDALNVREGDRVLEAGCGTCNLALKIKEKRANVVGLDYSQAALDICREKDGELRLVHADLTKELPFEEGHFDRISCNNVLYAIPESEQRKVLEEFKRVLKSGGRVVLVNPRKGWSSVEIYKEGVRKTFQRKSFLKGMTLFLRLIVPSFKIFYFNHLIQKETDYHFFESGEQKKLLQKSGFRVPGPTQEVYSGQHFLDVGVV